MTKKILLLENIRSLNNVGAIFRTVDGAGWDKIILTGYTPTPPRKEITKTALGAENSVRWEYYENVEDAIQTHANAGYTILSAEKNNSSIPYDSIEKSDKTLLIMGNEVDGVSETAQSLSKHTIHLPMRGEKTSLNVAVAAGVLLYSI